jgi:hypothetical protein
MMKFAIGLALAVFTLIFGGYTYWKQAALIEDKQVGIDEADSQREEAQDLQVRIKTVRRTSMVAGDDQKFTIERLLDIGAPGLEWRFIGTPRQYGNSRAFYRHTFRITGPTTYAESLEVLRKLVTLPGFTVYKYCYACSLPPKDTPATLQMVQIEGYLYVYDPATLY